MGGAPGAFGSPPGDTRTAGRRKRLVVRPQNRSPAHCHAPKGAPRPAAWIEGRGALGAAMGTSRLAGVRAPRPGASGTHAAPLASCLHIGGGTAALAVAVALGALLGAALPACRNRARDR